LNESWTKDKFEDIARDLKLILGLSFTARGVLNPLCAFFGGFIAQECFKAITGKFSPINQVFYYDASEILPHYELKEDLLKDEKAFSEIIK